jgi:hypothetical protein
VKTLRQGQFKHSAIRWLIALVVAVIPLGCGHIGPPIPPTRFTERTSLLSAVQRGAQILLTWPAPELNQAKSSRFYIERAEVYRLIERRNQEPVLDEDDYQQMAQVVGFLDRASLEAQAKTFGSIQYSDPIDLSNPKELVAVRLRYAIRYVNKHGQQGAFSNTVAIEPVPTVAQAPTGLHVVREDQDLILLAWDAPQANIDGTRPASVVGYNVYRHPAGRAFAQEPLNLEPITETTFADRKFKYQTNYVYTVRALSRGVTGLIESADSQPLSFTPIDRFPPTTPDPVSIASANGVISLFWPTSPEPDVAGYNVYRAEAADAPDNSWVRLNAQPLTTVTFHDERVVIGKRYFYRVTAMDRFGNESKPSRVVSEVANP